MTRWPTSLQGRLLALVLGGVLLLWAVATALAWQDMRHELDELLDAHLAQAAALLVAQRYDGHAEHDDEHRRQVDAPQLHRYAGRAAFQVWHEGALVLRSAGAPAEPLAAQRRGFSTVRLGGEHWRVFATRGAEHDVQVYVAERLDSRGSIGRAVLRGLWVPLVLALPLLGGAVWWAVRRALAPLRALSQALGARQPQALQPLALAGAPAELVPVVAALNALFGRIEQGLAAERRFTADAAHELRTPIAAIRAQAQVALGAADEPGRRHALQQTLAGCDRASRVVEQLLALARLESGAQVALAPVDLAALARRTAAELAGAALARQQVLELDAQGPCTVPGDDVLLGLLLRNLLDNALRYSPAGAAVRLALAGNAAGVQLQLDDAGPGMAEAARARLGERFFRVLGTGAAGSGLGWSIVQRVAQAHGAQVRAEPSPSLGGLRVTVHWPVAAGARAA